MAMIFHQTINTPNGPGIVQGGMFSHGQELIGVSHPPKAQVDQSKCAAIYGVPGGMWILAYYPKDEVTE